MGISSPPPPPASSCSSRSSQGSHLHRGHHRSRLFGTLYSKRQPGRGRGAGQHGRGAPGSAARLARLPQRPKGSLKLGRALGPIAAARSNRIGCGCARAVFQSGARSWLSCLRFRWARRCAGAAPVSKAGRRATAGGARRRSWLCGAVHGGAWRGCCAARCRALPCAALRCPAGVVGLAGERVHPHPRPPRTRHHPAPHGRRHR